MDDTTVSGSGRATGSRTNAQRKPHGRAAEQRTALDEMVAQVLIYSWSMATGRTLRRDVPPQWLTEEELISFWADDHIR